MRVLYDISTLGLGHLYQQSRGGAYRVDLHITEGLAADDACELLFCANHSTVAYHGCEAFLRGHPRLGAVPLIAPRTTGRSQAAVRTVASAAHRRIRHLFGSNVFPSAVRHVARSVDRRLHPAVSNPGGAVDVFHSSAIAPLPAAAEGRLPRRFLTIYDLAFVRFPKIYEPPYQRALTTAIDSLRLEDHVITNSRFVRDELMAEGIAPSEQVHVVPLAADPDLFYRCADPKRITAVRRTYGIPEGPYLLGVNTPDVRKNVPHAVHAFARAIHEGRGGIGSLVLTGLPGPGWDRVQQAIAEHADLRGMIILTGFVPDVDLAPLYTGAQAFVYNSIYEGFGLPPLEAMQCGTPVITSNTSSLPEVVGDGGLLVPPDDLDALAGAMLHLGTDSDLRSCLQQRALAQARRFSWEISTAATLKAYRAGLEG